MGLAAANNDVAAGRKSIEKASVSAGVECHFVRRIGRTRMQFRNGRPEALGILLGEEQRHAEQLGSIDEPPRVRPFTASTRSVNRLV